MARERLPAGPVLQRAYGVLDKYSISRSFFIKTDQKNCEILPPAQEAYDPTEPSVSIKPATEKKKKVNVKKQQTMDTIKQEKDLGNGTVLELLHRRK